MLNFSDEKMKRMSVSEILAEMSKTVNDLEESQKRQEKVLAECDKISKELDEMLKTL